MGFNCWGRPKTIPTRARSDCPTRKPCFSMLKFSFFACYHTNYNYNVKTGDDTETLRKVEAVIQAKFKNGLPPHLQPDATSMTYSGGDQSRIFVTSHSEFSSLHARDIQNILCNRLILVHGNPSGYNFGWDLESFGRLYDVDRKTSVHGAFGIHFSQILCLYIFFQFRQKFILKIPIFDITKEHYGIFTR